MTLLWAKGQGTLTQEVECGSKESTAEEAVAVLTLDKAKDVREPYCGWRYKGRAGEQVQEESGASFLRSEAMTHMKGRGDKRKWKLGDLK